MARLLLVHGASPGEKDEDGHNPEEWHLLLGRSVSSATDRSAILQFGYLYCLDLGKS